MTRLTTCSDPGTVAARAARHVIDMVQQARDERAVAHVALSGGTTPALTYERLREQAGDLDAAEWWFADERCVPPDDDQSNYKLVKETLLDGSPIPPERVHRMEGELGPDPGAERYGRLLRERTPGADGPPVLDVIVLGIGPDGHVASLMPDSPTLEAPADAVSLGVHDSPKPPPERITLSLAVLRAARSCLLIAHGAEKAAAVNLALGEPTRHVPASLLRRERLTVIVDDAAAPGGHRR